MKGPMKVLLVSSEVAPFSKTGGLADVSGSLPIALKHLGCDIRVVTPLYKMVRESGCAAEKILKGLKIKAACHHTVSVAGIAALIEHNPHAFENSVGIVEVRFVSTPGQGRRNTHGNDCQSHPDTKAFHMIFLLFLKSVSAV